MTTIEQLEEDYCRSSNVLRDKWRELGFQPGARVIAKYRDEPAQSGVIAPFGIAWNGAGLCLPVRLDSGRTRLWSASHLTLETPPPPKIQ